MKSLGLENIDLKKVSVSVSIKVLVSSFSDVNTFGQLVWSLCLCFLMEPFVPCFRAWTLPLHSEFCGVYDIDWQLKPKVTTCPGSRRSWMCFVLTNLDSCLSISDIPSNIYIGWLDKSVAEAKIPITLLIVKQGALSPLRSLCKRGRWKTIWGENLNTEYKQVEGRRCVEVGGTWNCILLWKPEY